MGRTSTLNNINYYKKQINYLHKNINELQRKIQVLHEMLTEHQNKAGIYRIRLETEAANLNRIKNLQYIKSAQRYNEDMNDVLNGYDAGAAIANLEVIKNSIIGGELTMGNLIVADSEYVALQEKYLTLGEKMENQVSEYIQLLNDICNNSVTSGAVYTNLLAFKGECEGLKEKINEITDLLSINMQDYIDEIDDKDQYIY